MANRRTERCRGIDRGRSKSADRAASPHAVIRNFESIGVVRRALRTRFQPGGSAWHARAGQPLIGRPQNRPLSSVRVRSPAIYGSSGRRSMAVSTVTCPIPAVRNATWLDSFAVSTSSGMTQPSSAMNAAGATTHGSAPTNGVQGGARSESVLSIGRLRRTLEASSVATVERTVRCKWVRQRGRTPRAIVLSALDVPAAAVFGEPSLTRGAYVHVSVRDHASANSRSDDDERGDCAISSQQPTC